MTATKITNADISSLRVSSLPSRPTAPKSFGGAGYTATQLKEAFDRLPLYIISRFNELIDDITREGDEGLLGSIPSGIEEGHTLADLVADIKSGNMSTYIDVLGESLAERIVAINEEMEKLRTSYGSSIDDVNASVESVRSLENSVAEIYERLDDADLEIARAKNGVANLNILRSADIKSIYAEIKKPTEISIDCGGPADLA